VARGWSYLYLASRGWSYLYPTGTTPNEGASQRGEEMRDGLMSQGAWGDGWLYIGGGGRWHLHQMALPQGGSTLGRRPLGETLGQLAPCLGPPNGLPHGGPLGVTLLFYLFINSFLILLPFLDIRCIIFCEKF
jgi:hypothetical protein